MEFLPAPDLLDSPRGRRLSRDGLQQGPATGEGVPLACRVAIVGGGPAAVSLAANLWHRWGDLDDVVIVDGHGQFMRQFFSRVDALEQAVLRSPYEHHMGTHEHRDCELLDFARCRWASLTNVERRQVRMAMSGQRSVVPLDVFRAYADHTISNHLMATRCWATHVDFVEQQGDGWAVHHTGGVMTAERVVVAVGEQVNEIASHWQVSEKVQRWDRYRPGPPGRTVVVSGSGLSAAHLIADLCSSGSHVVWVQRGTERYQCADVNARFFRPEGRAAFRALTIPARIRTLARHHVPTIMFEFRPLLLGWASQGCLSVHRSTLVRQIYERPDGRLTVSLSDGTTCVADQAIAAHGTSPTAPPVPQLPVTSLALPILDDRTLEPRGSPGLYFSGVHAGMSIGPASRNIDGMRIAAQQIADALELRRDRVR